jgi:hypothetical protein
LEPRAEGPSEHLAYQGSIVAAFSVSSAVQYMSDERMDQLVGTVGDVACAISRAMGWAGRRAAPWADEPTYRSKSSTSIHQLAHDPDELGRVRRYGLVASGDDTEGRKVVFYVQGKTDEIASLHLTLYDRAG